MLISESSPSQIRSQVREGRWKTHTSGLAKGFVQCNVVILPEQEANHFLRFCQQNPKSCPVIGMSKRPGDPMIEVGGNLLSDIRTDVPEYSLFEHGQLQGHSHDITELWRDDLVTFLLGCSFSFEEALLADGIEIRNVTERVNVPMFNTNIANKSAGRFAGNMVVSMRPMPAKDAIRAIQICSRFPQVHGAPIHIGEPSLIGIDDLNKPDYGDAVSINETDIPVFWACGVTPQNAIRLAELEFCITHSPGCMLITDIPNSQLSIL